MGQRGPRSSKDSHRSHSNGDEDALRTGPASDRRRAAFEARQKREGQRAEAAPRERDAVREPQSRGNKPNSDRQAVRSQRREDRRDGDSYSTDRRRDDQRRAPTRRSAPNRGSNAEYKRERRSHGYGEDRQGRGSRFRDAEERRDRRESSGPTRGRSGDRNSRYSRTGERRFDSRDDRRDRSRQRGGQRSGKRVETGGFQGDRRFDRQRDRPTRFDSERVSEKPAEKRFDGVIAQPEIWIDEGAAPQQRERTRRGHGRRSPVNQPGLRSSHEPSRRPGRQSAGQKKNKSTKRDRSDATIFVDKVVLTGLTGNKERAEKLARRIKRAASSFESEYYDDARRTLAPIVKEVPDFADLRELNGLVMYRLGRWRDAIRELEAFRQLSPGSTEQHPVLADSYRAIGRYHEVGELWDELRMASPSGELVDEGRIVMAGALADQGEFADAIRLLSKGFKLPKNAQDRHLRRGYVLADLYERVGDVPQARELFSRIARIDPDFVDVSDRLRHLN